MEYNLDPEVKKSQRAQTDRSEWCAICYHGNYFPHKCAYAIELNWMVATGCVINELVRVSTNIQRLLKINVYVGP